MNFENSIKLFLSTMENKIFINIVLTSLYIMDYIIESGKIKLNKNNIIPIDSDFDECIQLTKELIAILGYKKIEIWNIFKKNQIIEKIDININKSIRNFDILLMDNENIIITQPEVKTLRIYDIKSLKEIKKIKNIYCISKYRGGCLIKINQNYILINCKKGFGLFLIKTKELVQYIEDFYPLYINKKICLGDNGNIYCLYVEENKNNQKHKQNSIFINVKAGFQTNNKTSIDSYDYKIKILNIKFWEGTLKIIKDYKQFGSKENGNILKCIYINQRLFICGYHSYIYSL